MRTKNHLLNELIELNRDRIAGFNKAIGGLDDQELSNDELKGTFSELSGQSGTFLDELSALVSADGGTAASEQSVMGGLHGSLLEVKAALSTSNREVILDEVQRGEALIARAYQTVIDQGRLDGAALEKVMAHQSALETAKGKLSALAKVAK